MILGIGNDIIEVERIKSALEKYQSRFLNRIFTPAEQAYCLQHTEAARHLAGRFAAKESVVKALGIGFRNGVNWTDIEINNDTHGKPLVICSSYLHSLFPSLELLISISHCHHYATAFAMWIKNPG